MNSGYFKTQQTSKFSVNEITENFEATFIEFFRFSFRYINASVLFRIAVITPPTKELSKMSENSVEDTSLPDVRKPSNLLLCYPVFT